ncbi:hypothetical protein HLB23_19330 [Nocardia uniformis]|uniref:proton-translocating NAD(P)(+) transhydrogenase n=1 Tax=Nocardia uniformis TaxID=53432 RepID=A0A849CF47_9NOCA|nr:hypothetical protein [Nocardia uniformis]NNH71981.1 hypothetical protein [Nocardia uniformis]
MIAGVLRETAPRERRVALTPNDVRRLVGAGVGVIVERDAGVGAGFADAAYRAAGASTGADNYQVFERTDLIAWVKTPAFELDSMPLRAGMRLIGFQDPIVRQGAIAALRARGIDSVAFELVPRDGEPTAFDALSAMSRFAGRLAYSEGRQLLSPKVRTRAVRSLILGCGQAGLAAIRAAVALGDEKPTVIGKRMAQEAAALSCGAGVFVPHPEQAVVRDHIERETPDLIVCAAVHRGERAPVLLDTAALNALGAGAVVVDLTAKAGGNCVATRIDSTVTLPNGVVVTHRSNYPSAQPRAASEKYGAAMAAMILELIGAPGEFALER